ncbi:PP2C family protein-serine/threonine phosphatase [Yinghuangia seranimata]|uniref:PP2C family protein-serine/threonine phosphatase n=1 Tax=Yinghuangia seranimata TaxID=408067 RepID=UPI00248BD181|nr:PP2C family protein-serine/threonine phosphatase [Yinghuangia seranimata]MDI2127360.1 PP2C family protein-serine/threonine phosphatase [Yinghuangia seranimata]
MFWGRHVLLPSDRFLLVLLLAVVTMCGLLPDVDDAWFPVTMLVIPVIIGGLVLSMPSLLLLYGACAGVLLAEERAREPDQVTPGAVGVVAVVAFMVLFVARKRTRLGLRGVRGESMLFDLQDRLRAHGLVPELPAQWHTDVVIRPAGGTAFSGDFVVATRGRRGGRTLEIALIDVSGKGLAAGTRALLLSGAFGGLLGSLPPRGFLPAANDYLMRQGWDEGFATAVHVAIDLETGKYQLLSAGHPPGAHWVAASGRWEVSEAEGPLLGIIPGATFGSVTGELRAGDALLLFTDGMVELPGQDIDVGIDRLLGEAEKLVSDDFLDGARRIVDSASGNIADDRAVVLIRRR